MSLPSKTYPTKKADASKKLISIHKRAIQKVTSLGLQSFGRQNTDTPLWAADDNESLKIQNETSSDTAILEKSAGYEDIDETLKYKKLSERLYQLKRRKIFLKAEIERERLQSNVEPCTVGQELKNVSLFSCMKSEKRPYLHDFDNGASELVLRALSSSSSKAEEAAAQEIKSDSDIASQLSKTRKRRKIIAAHRLSGISCIHSGKDNCIGAKIEVCVDGGRFIGTHYAFFDLKLVSFSNAGDSHCNSSPYQFQDDDEGQFYEMQLIQHTLPYSVDVDEIVKRNFCTSSKPSNNNSDNGTTTHLISDNDTKKDRVDSSDQSQSQNVNLTVNCTSTGHDSQPSIIMHSLKNCLGDMYDAAYSYAKRTIAYRDLQTMMLNATSATSKPNDINVCPNDKNKDHGVVVQNVGHSNTFDCISYNLYCASIRTLSKVQEMKGKGRKLTVQLTYLNQLLCVPTRVHLVWANEHDNTKSLTTVDGSYTSDGSDDNDDLVETMKEIAASFRVLDVVDATKRSIKIIRKEELY